MKIGNTKYFFDLSGFLVRLSSEGFRIGVDTHLNTQQILKSLPKDFDEQQLENLLMPLICKSQKQQYTFKAQFRQFLVQDIILNKYNEPEKKEKLSFLQKLKNYVTLEKLKRFIKNNRLELAVTLTILLIITEYLIFSTFYLVVAAVCFGLFYFLVQFIKQNKQKRAVAEREYGLPPEYYAKIYSPSIQLNIPFEILQTTARLRTREPLGLQKLNLQKTIENTIKNLGAFSPVYADFTQYTEYLILIQADNKDDHRALLYDAFYEELRYRNIPTNRYFFRDKPQLFFQKDLSESINIDQLIGQNQNAVLIMFASLGAFLRAKDGKAYKWTEKFTVFKQRFLFLPFAYKLEVQLAQQLSSVFNDVLLADEGGFSQLEKLLNNHANHNFAEQLKIKTNISLSAIAINSEEDIINLAQKFYDLRLLKWIYACAVYPDFSWKLTLFLGDALSDEHFLYNSWENIKQLNRIEWFKQAYMPDHARELVLNQTKWINDFDKQKIKNAILKALTEHKNSNLKIKQKELTRIYSRKQNNHLSRIREHLTNEGDFVSAKLIDKNLQDILLFDLPENWITEADFNDENEKNDDKDKLEFLQAQRENTCKSYENYVENYPQGKYISQAKEKINELCKNKNKFSEPDMIAVKGGTFKMGSNVYDDEKPIHEVSVSDFYIGKYEVTIQQYMEFVNDTKTNYPEWLEKGNSYNINENGSDKDYYRKVGMSLDEKDKNKPITGVSWDNALAYCKWLSKKAGKNYRLPSEAEWEYAAGGGKNNRIKYAGTNNEKDLGNYAWYRSNSGSKTHVIGTKKANKLGIYDMSGNVYEWCSDKWHNNYDNAPKDGSAWTSGNSSGRVDRGGSWSNDAEYCRSANRDFNSPNGSSNHVGFRLVLVP